MLRAVEITRYITPLREGSSLPALVEADDEREYVIKFRGAGHGAKALIAELVVGEIGRALAPWPAPRNFATYSRPSSASTSAGSELPSRSGVT